MKQYSNGWKGAVVVIHQMFFIMMLCGIFGAGYMMQRRVQGIGVPGTFAVIGMVGAFVAQAYLTAIAGRRSADDPAIYLNITDKLYTDIQLVLFIGFVYLTAYMGRSLRKLDFAFSGLMVAVGTVGYLVDAVFLLFYLSLVRRSKNNTLLEHSLTVVVFRFFKNLLSGGQNPRLCTRKSRERNEIQNAVEAIAAGALDTHLEEENFHGQERELACSVNHIRAGLSGAVMERIHNERLKADLITNVSHDIKTPLTSIVNYVDLLKRENLENENARRYIQILDEKSQRLKQLTEDLVEASRTTEGSGLGLSIAKSLTNLMGGTFCLKLDGDLFAAMISFPVV